MALSAKLVMRQGQTLVMTPQLMQAIKLLQLSNVELASFLEEELERNPLLERAEEGQDLGPPGAGASPSPSGTRPKAIGRAEDFETDARAMEAGLGTELENSFEADGPPVAPEPAFDGQGLSATSWTGAAVRGRTAKRRTSSAMSRQAGSLHDHLAAQLLLAVPDPVDRLIGHALIDAIDDAGYLSEPLDDIAARLGAPLRRVEAILAIVQTFEPTGVAARDLAECLALQLRERDRFDPAMQALVANLKLLATRDFAGLKQDLRRRRRRFGRHDRRNPAPRSQARPRLRGRPDPDGRAGRLRAGGAGRLLAHRAQYRRAAARAGQPDLSGRVSAASRAARPTGASSPIACRRANWLTKSLEQRARTILKVSAEIVRQQDAFFARGVEFLRPLNLKTVADAIGMHESTVSRVTSNKYMASPRGIFELKYFFTASIASTLAGALAFGRGRPVPHQAIDRPGEPGRRAVRRCHRAAPQGGRHRHRAADGRQISRKPAHSFLGRTAARQGERRHGPGSLMSSRVALPG